MTLLVNSRDQITKIVNYLKYHRISTVWSPLMFYCLIIIFQLCVLSLINERLIIYLDKSYTVLYVKEQV